MLLGEKVRHDKLTTDDGFADMMLSRWEFVAFELAKTVLPNTKVLIQIFPTSRHCQFSMNVNCISVKIAVEEVYNVSFTCPFFKECIKFL